MNQNFAAMILGGTGQVGGAAVAELLAIPECREVVMVTRKPIAARSRVRNVVLDTGAADFAERTAALARDVLSQGPASAVSCLGVGSGSRRWSEEELKRLELGVVGAFARGCHDAGIAQFCLLSAVGSTARSRFRYVRVMGMKEDTVRSGSDCWGTSSPEGLATSSANSRSLCRRRDRFARSRGRLSDLRNAAMKRLAAQVSRETAIPG